MKGRLFKIWDHVRSSFWFTPGVMAGMAIALAIASVYLDQPMTEWLALNLGWTFNGGAEGASAVLGIIAGSMITIAGVVFSMTLVALSLASSQLGPRLLGNFMRDTTTQVVLGTFVATFLYCLIVLRSVRHVSETIFVPHLSVTLGVLLAVASVGVFIYFIHHVSVSIQANEIAARIGKELIAGIEGMFPGISEDNGPSFHLEPPDANFLATFGRDARPVGATADGYLQFIDVEDLLCLATDENLVIRLEQKPGSYVVAGCPLATISPGNRLTRELTARIHSLFVLGHQRTDDQDIEFSVNQLVEMAVRALSPGLNDPFTAITCVDHLGSALCRLATRDIPSRYHHDSRSQLRVIAPVLTFAGIMDAAFNQIRQASRSSVAVSVRLLDTIIVIAGFTVQPGHRASLLRHAEMIARGANEALPEDSDRDTVTNRLRAIKELCNAAYC